jgi:hypothetical protein
MIQTPKAVIPAEIKNDSALSICVPFRCLLPQGADGLKTLVFVCLPSPTQIARFVWTEEHAEDRGDGGPHVRLVINDENGHHAATA